MHAVRAKIAWAMFIWAATACVLPAQTVREVTPPRGFDGLTDPGIAERDQDAAQNTPGPEQLESPQPVIPDTSAEQDSQPGMSAGDQLKLADVIASLYRSYPLILQARLERSRTQGEIIGAYGTYDTKAEAYSLSEPLGFYKNYRHGLGFARQTWWGGYMSAGYRVGRGVFPPWYQERPTNEGGEFKLGLAQPLLQGRAIDPGRVAVFQATIDNRAADPLVQEALLNASVEAAALYWEWVSSGAKLRAQRELLELAEVRNKQLEDGVEAGYFAPVELIFNQQLIAERRGSLLEAEQKYRSLGFKLSLYLRDEQGQRLVPRDEWLPRRFPQIDSLTNQNFDQDLADALARRPEPRLLRLAMNRLEQERRLADNQLLPRIDVVAEGSKDMGLPTSSKNDKGPFVLAVGLMGEVPVQRRKARGKLQATTAKIAQVDQKLRLQIDKIATELLTAQNALAIAEQVVEQERLAVTASLETLSRYRFAFTRGKTDLIYLNVLESKANENELKLIESQRLWFSALAEMQRALGLDPLEQSLNIASLPQSELPSPGNLPQPEPPTEDQFDAEWEAQNRENGLNN